MSDVVANNFTPGVMERFGLGWPKITEINPQVIYLAMSMQGDDGPARNYLGYGITIGALTGFQYLTGTPGRIPIGTNTNYPDHIPNPAHAAFAVLAALRHRRRTGQGQYIDLAQTESTIAVIGPAIIEAPSRPPGGRWRCGRRERPGRQRPPLAGAARVYSARALTAGSPCRSRTTSSGARCAPRCGWIRRCCGRAGRRWRGGTATARGSTT